MIHSRRFTDRRLLETWLNGGDPVSQGNTASHVAAGSTLTDLNATFQTDGVTAGQYVHVDGEGFFAISAVGSETALTISGAFAATQAGADRHWRVVPSAPRSWADIELSPDNGNVEGYLVLYEDAGFKNRA